MKRIFLLLFFISSVLSAQVVHVKWSMESKKVSDCEYDLIVKAKIDKHWHIYSITQTDPAGPNATSFSFTPSKDYKLVGKVIEPKPHKEFDKQFEMNVASHEGNVTFTQRVQLLNSGKITIKGKYEAQQCDSAQCIFPPADELKFEVEGTPLCTSQSSVVETVTTAGTTTVSGDSAAVSDASVKNTNTTAVSEAEAVTPVAGEVKASDKGWLAIFLAGFIGGFAALLTPCVFPMIPMNVSFFTKRSKNKAEGMKNALIYASFIILLYVGLGLGVTLVFGAGALHTLSTNVWFNLAFFVLLLVFAASFLGAFEIVLPSAFVNKMDSKADKGGLIGIFFMAFTLALVSFSCTGPIIGTLLVEAASTGSLSGPFWGMFGFALALSLPFGLFAAFPGWLNSLPSSGGWLNSVKVVLGFLELALALKFASNADLVVQAGYLTREVFIGLWIVIFLLQGLYLIGVFKTSHDSDLKSVSVTRLMFAIASFFIVIYLIPGMFGAPLKLFSGILPPLEYSESPHGFGGGNGGGHQTASNSNVDPEFAKDIETNKNGIVHFKNNYAAALAYAKKTGKPLMVDFTGHACANCRKTEDYVWPDPEVTKRLNNDVVLVSLYVDDKRSLDPKDYMTVEWYGKQREITDIGDKFKYMEETLYGQSTQPLYVILDHNEKPLNPVRGYDPNIPDYIKWLDEGISKFKASK
ncbi:MAG TPA: cytochrome c biogenesis protein CcdA [Bacteroidia bacterium]|nr:cytochrome c biogenesis protein CcdA [Bacteroidia bacterium]